MTTENNGAPARDIPVPPGGGSWRFDEAKSEWVSNDPVPPATESAAEVAEAGHTDTEQEQ
jgi:hypothetical protein